MRFAWSRATDRGSDRGASDDEAPYELASVELLTDDGERRVGWIATQGQRTSDWLNAHDEIPIHGLVAADDATPASPPSMPAAPAETLDRDSVVWAVPPPLPPNRHLRLHRRRVLVHLELDGWEVSGQVHVRPGADATDQVLRGTRHMVPLTEVQVVARTDQREAASLPVLIVNRAHVGRVVVDAEHASAAVPEPVASNPAPPVAQPAPAGEAAATAVAPEAATPDVTAQPIESGAELVQTALTILLETGMIDVVEFQSIRARIPSPPSDTGTPASPAEDAPSA